MSTYSKDSAQLEREVEDADGVHAATMITIPDQEDRLAVQDLHTALAKLPREQREALLLIGAEGLSYEEAAEALATRVGTIKSRVNRARTRLAELMGIVREDGIAGSRGDGLRISGSPDAESGIPKSPTAHHRRAGSPRQARRHRYRPAPARHSWPESLPALSG